MNHAEVTKAAREIYNEAAKMPEPTEIARDKMKTIIMSEPLLIAGELVTIVPKVEYDHGKEFSAAIMALNVGQLDNGIVFTDEFPACKGVGHCAVGALLTATRLPQAHIAELSDAADDWDERTHLLMFKHYGISYSQTSRIMSANDQNGGMMVDATERVMLQRREAVCALIDRFTFNPGAMDELTDADGHGE